MAADPVRVHETTTVDLPVNAETAFSFMWDPASTRTLFDSTEVAVTLPGRSGVGEIQAFVQRTPEGRLGILHEVIEMEQGRRAVTRSLMYPPTWGALTVEPLDPGSCRLTQEFWADLPAGVLAGTDRALRDQFRQRLHELAARLGAWARDHRP
ncbi:SRPBCC family protein [Micromonospora sp. WMMD980]|uniref:SRPBCC family protein n=1 Tax=Micromonospora sp. WMMD980 TaxID=3016088 RepID=UPI002415A6F6|nr:SRPBCC family protein [Micromonospora sp. WMMD980]MDG4803918.1 SRPBCC family protein [Micromonospora sp. WMMD980]